jgi:hypothetical protein
MSTELFGADDISQSDTDKFLSHNTANRQIEGQTTRVISRTNGGPPVSSVDGDIYIVDVNTGDWAGASVDDAAHKFGGQWVFYTPEEGVQKYWVNDEDAMIVYDGAGWINLPATSIGLAGIPDFRIIFAEGGLAAEDSNLTWDDTNKVLQARTIATGGETAPDCATGGICVNHQNTPTAIAISFKSADVAHGVTSVVEPDTYGYISKKNVNVGGVNLVGFGEDSRGLENFGIGDSEASAFNVLAAMVCRGGVRSGTAIGTISATGNVVNIVNNTTVLSSFKGNGNQILLGTLSTGAEVSPDVDLGGICVNHGANDGIALSIKNSDVAHPFTSQMETDTYLRVGKVSSTAGGAEVVGGSEIANAFRFMGLAAVPNTTGAGVVRFDANKTDGGTGLAALAATEQAHTFYNSSTLLASIKGSGNQVWLGGLATGDEAAPDVDLGGICINHGANDGKSLTLKNSDVAHGMTTIAETDTYMYTQKADNAAGGFSMVGLSSGVRGFSLIGAITTETTTFTAEAGIRLQASLKSGTTITSLGSTGNLVTVLNNGTVTGAFKGGGNLELLGGIKLSNTGTVLANYEEGTWVPVIADAIAGGNLANFTLTSALYTRVGRLVNVTCFLQAINTAGMTAGNTLIIRGLPFANAGGNTTPVGTVRPYSITYTGQLTALPAAAASHFTLTNSTTGAATAELTVAAINSGVSRISVNITYSV